MPPKPPNTDYDPLELADGWDREADDRNMPSAAAPEDDWETPLDDVNWDEPAVKKMTEEAPPAPEEILPAVSGDKLVEIPEDDNIADADFFKQPEEDSDPFAEPELPPAPPPESDPPDDSPPLEPAAPENLEEADDLEKADDGEDETDGGEDESENSESEEDLTAEADAMVAFGQNQPVKVELDLEGMRIKENLLDEEGEEEDEEDDDGYKESGEADGLPPEMDPGPASMPPSGKITWSKLLLLLVPAVLLLVGLTFMGYKLFFSSPEKVAAHQIPDVWPAPEPVGPGDWQLEPFFFLLSGSTSQEPVKVMITVFYDQPELFLAFKDDLPRQRDYIFRYMQNQDAGILTNPERREKLQSDLRAMLNQKLGAPVITYLGLVFIR